jgi:hypothetical protein
MKLLKVIEAKLTLQAASSTDLWSPEYQGYLEKLGQEALVATKLVWHNNEWHNNEGIALP